MKAVLYVIVLILIHGLPIDNGNKIMTMSYGAVVKATPAEEEAVMMMNPSSHNEEYGQSSRALPGTWLHQSPQPYESHRQGGAAAPPPSSYETASASKLYQPRRRMLLC
ncbi:unnamed protein product [Cuscuta europaea]|uniref:Uncharacterized protein n=1 Tax=Cuscuta europaea TaxID=41803 RepID=A0A9P1DZ52_CUSEU|nr:unnamed protein product [Cuscuta europaea]